ncbi:glycosyltransferase [Marispirochaeta sp.]|uniref:glycosyltransferase n=1 Tax=Marispirochaeta sp. TaxID=2038653 RepID=UPI0029C84386|nr:glycosyltransferase [Marispirochaeta sp.]
MDKELKKIKVAHINNPPALGVDKKLLLEAQAAYDEGLNFDFYIIKSSFDDRDVKNVHYRKDYKLWYEGTKLRFIGRFFNWKNRLPDIVDFDMYDMIILRFGKVSFSKYDLFKRYGHKILTEHHTDEVGEIRSKKTLKRYLLGTVVSLISKRSLKLVAGIIAVTNEIRKVELNKAGNKPSVVITNGIGVEQTPFSGFKQFNETNLDLVFVSSHFQAWQGVDRLFEGIKQYKGSVTITLYLIGNYGNDLKLLADEINSEGKHRIVLTGRIEGEKIAEYYETANLAVGSLAQHRRNMKEACTLKIREYMARGIPFIYAYDDPDVPENASFAVKFNNDDSPINVDRIIDFARAVSSSPDMAVSLRNIAKKNLDWRVKVRQMYDFAAKVYRQQNNEQPE